MGPDDGTTKTELPPVHSADAVADPSQELETMTTSNKDDIIFSHAQAKRSGLHMQEWRRQTLI